MRSHSILAILLILISAACVDRINFDIGSGNAFPVVIDGFISDEPGPYIIRVSKAFDIESKFSIKTPISIKKLVLSDDHGNREELSEVDYGLYKTDATGIRGTVGRVYKIEIELLDGRVYESKPDTLAAPGKIDSIYYNFREDKTVDGASKYGFDILFNSSSGSKRDYHFLWKFTGTFKADVTPLPSDHNDCFYYGGKCNYVPFCSGLLNVGGYTFITAVFKRVGPCTCCTCWYNIFNTDVLLSDGQFLRMGNFQALKILYIPIDPWIFQNKVHAEVSQMSLSRQSFDFWKSVRNQKNAANSLFQPITGKIPSNFVQLAGPQGPIEGLFYAASITRKAIFITREDVHPPSIIPSIQVPWTGSCLKLFPNATTEKPSYWKD